MSRITKTIANEMAVKMTKAKRDKAKELYENLKVVFQDIYLKSIPPIVMEAFKDNKSYFNTRSYFVLEGNGFNYESFETKDSLPSSSRSFVPSKEEAKILTDLKNKLKDKQEEIEDLTLEIEVALMGLKTFSKVNLEFLEATPFLPEIKNSALMLNISDLRNKLK